MTLVDRPLIQYAIDEARAAGIKEFIFVTSRGKGGAGGLFRRPRPSWKARCTQRQGRAAGGAEVDTNMDSGAIAYVRQHEALGLGHAVWCAKRLIGNEPFAVILPDDVIAAEKPCLHRWSRPMQKTGGCMVAAMEVPPEKTSSYGVLDVAEDMGALVKVQGHGRKAQARGRAVEPGGHRALYPDAAGHAEPEPHQDRARAARSS